MVSRYLARGVSLTTPHPRVFAKARLPRRHRALGHRAKHIPDLRPALVEGLVQRVRVLRTEHEDVGVVVYPPMPDNSAKMSRAVGRPKNGNIIA